MSKYKILLIVLFIITLLVILYFFTFNKTSERSEVKISESNASDLVSKWNELSIKGFDENKTELDAIENFIIKSGYKIYKFQDKDGNWKSWLILPNTINS